MNEVDLLIGIAEIAIGTAGFSGIFYALVAIDQRDSTMLNILIGVLSCCFSVVLSSLVGSAITLFIEEPWGWASLGAAAIGLTTTLIVFRVFRAVEDSTTYDIPWWEAELAITSTLGFGGLILLILNTPVFGFSSFKLFYLALCFTLASGLIQFMYIIFTLAIKKVVSETDA